MLNGQILGNKKVQIELFLQAILDINDKNSPFTIGFTGSTFYFESEDKTLLAKANLWWHNHFE
jgi:hypothetical protein